MKSLCALTWLLFVGLCCCTGCDRSTVVANTSATGATPNGTASQIRESSFDDLKFEMELTDKFHRKMLGSKVEELFNRSIRIRGFMYPTLKRRGLTGFVLVRDNQECCFGPGAALFDCIRVDMHENSTTEFSIRPITVTGNLKFEEFTDLDGTTRAIYLLEEGEVE